MTETGSGASVDRAARATALAGRTVNTLFSVDDIMATTLGGGNSARRALFGASCAGGALFGFDDVGHDGNR